MATIVNLSRKNDEWNPKAYWEKARAAAAKAAAYLVAAVEQATYDSWNHKSKEEGTRDRRMLSNVIDIAGRHKP